MREVTCESRICHPPAIAANGLRRSVRDRSILIQAIAAPILIYLGVRDVTEPVAETKAAQAKA